MVERGRKKRYVEYKGSKVVGYKDPFQGNPIIDEWRVERNDR